MPHLKYCSSRLHGRKRGEGAGQAGPAAAGEEEGATLWEMEPVARKAPACQGPRGRTLRAAAPNG